MADSGPESSIEKKSGIRAAIGKWAGDTVDNAIRGILKFTAQKVYGAHIAGLEVFEDLKKQGKSFLITPNHTSFLDAVLLAAALPVRPAIAIDTKRYEQFMSHWWSRPFMKRANLFPVDPENPYAIKHLIRHAQSGVPILIFPEGRITRNGAMGKIFDGAPLVAMTVGIPVVPTYIEGLQRLPFGAKTPVTFPRRWRPEIKLEVNQPRMLEIPEDLGPKEKRVARRHALQRAMQEMVVRSLDKDKTLIDALHDAAANYGKDRAVLDDVDNKDVTYQTLLEKVYGLGDKLAAITEKDENVGLILPNSVAAVASLFALNAYGRRAAFMNFGPKVPPEEVLANAETIKMKTLVTSRALLDKMTKGDREKLQEKLDALSEKYKIVYLEDVKESITATDKLQAGLRARGLLPSPADAPKGTDPAVIVFTSGSEGAPKGVVHSSNSLLANTEQVRSVITTLEPTDRVFNVMPIFHSFGMTGGILLPLLNGMASFQWPAPLKNKVIPGQIYDYDATIMFGSDTFLKNYAHYADDEDFVKIKMIVAGGEALGDDTTKTYWERFGKPIYEAYGRTEQGPAVSLNVPGANRIGTMGRLLPGIEARFEKKEGYERGARMFLRGPNMALGYMFNENPGVIEPFPDGWDDTGDIIEMSRDLYLTFIDRDKRMAKIGAEYVPLNRIEKIAKLASHRPKAEHAAIEGANKIILFTTDPDLKASTMKEVAEKPPSPLKPFNTFGLPKNNDIHHVKELPHGGIGKVNYPLLKRMFNEGAIGGPETPVEADDVEDVLDAGLPPPSLPDSTNRPAGP